MHNLTTRYTHCGRCSQCVDRRFAMLAAKIERFDPEDAYRVELLTGKRKTVTDKEVALSYVRLARQYQLLPMGQLLVQFPVLSRVIDQLHEPPETSLGRLKELLARHGSYVTEVMENALSSEAYEEAHTSSLLKLHGVESVNAALESLGRGTSMASADKEDLELVLQFSSDEKRVSVNSLFDLNGVNCQVLHTLAQNIWLLQGMA